MKTVILPITASRKELRRHGITQQASGCYCVFNRRGECLYVGMSRSLETRIFSHWRYDAIYEDDMDGPVIIRGRHWKLFSMGLDTDDMHECAAASSRDMLHVTFSRNPRSLEGRLIRRYQPVFNRLIPGSTKH